MRQQDVRSQWESAAPGWARWEATVAAWMAPATEAMLDMAGIEPGSRVLDLASGAGSQTLEAAHRAGPGGHVVANDVAETMLQYVRERARAAGLINVTTDANAAEDLDLPPDSFDAVVCRLGLMLFANPARALTAVQRALKPGGRIAVVVFTTPAANAIMAGPMQILLRHAGRTPPGPGEPGIFALGKPGVLEKLLLDAGFVDIAQRILTPTWRMSSAAEALTMMQEAFGAYRAVLHECAEAVREAAWAEVADFLASFESPGGFAAPAEVLVAAAAKPSLADERTQ